MQRKDNVKRHRKKTAISMPRKQPCQHPDVLPSSLQICRAINCSCGSRLVCTFSQQPEQTHTRILYHPRNGLNLSSNKNFFKQTKKSRGIWYPSLMVMKTKAEDDWEIPVQWQGNPNTQQATKLALESRFRSVFSTI